MRGRLVGRGGGDDEEKACRRLIAGVVVQAARDALTGDVDAGTWLTETGPGVALALGLDAGAFAGWQSAELPAVGAHRAAGHKRGWALTPSERSKAYRERKQREREEAERHGRVLDG